MGIMPTETELALEQTQQGVSYEVLNIRVILFSIHDDNGNPSRVNIKQLYGRGSKTLSWKPCQGGSSKLSLPDHRYKKRCYNLIPAESRFTTSCSIDKDKYNMKDQEHVLKSSAISDV
ncbi:hypothetical protein Tco_1392749 [Tanacetum coccineum]